MKIRLIETPLSIPRYRQLRLPAVAAELGKYCDVEIVDENVEAVPFTGADLVGITCQTYNAGRAMYLAGEYRKRGVKTMLGGVFATAMPEEALRHFDSVVTGEIEGLGGEIARDLEKGALKRRYALHAPPDLSLVEKPRFDLLKNDRYYYFNYPVETSRGCPHGCSFCFSSYQYPVYRTRPLEQVERDLAARDHGMVEVVDLHFGANRKHLHNLCALFANLKVPAWFGETTLTSLDDPETLRLLEKSNCRMVFVGLESISPRALAEINKRFNPAGDYARIIRACHDHGILVHAGFIWGLDSQGIGDVDATLMFCRENRLYLASNNIYTCFPGTTAHDKLAAEGRIISGDFRDYDSAHLTVRTEGMRPEALLREVTRFNRKFYSWPSILARAFQPAIANFAMLYDYLGFNYLYRAYYAHWTRRFASGVKRLAERSEGDIIVPAENPADWDSRNSLPRHQGDIPAAYAVFDLAWRWWNFWFEKISGPSRAPSAALRIFSAALLSAGTVLLGYAAFPGGASRLSGVHSLLVSLGCYAILHWATSLAHFALSGRASSPAKGIAAVLLLSLPLIAHPFLFPWDHYLAPMALAWFTVLLILKAASYQRSAERRTSGAVKYLMFQYLWPSLDFDTAFRVDFSEGNFNSAFRTWILGTMQMLYGAGAAALIFAAAAIFPAHAALDTPGPWIVAALKSLALYCGAAGFFNLVRSWWKAWGFSPPPAFASPLLAATPAEFWRCFATDFSDVYVKAVYAPLVRRLPGAAGRAFAAFIPFLASAVIFGYILASSGVLGDLAARGVIVSRWTPLMSLAAFFALNGAVVASEKVMLRGRAPRGTALRAASGIITLLFLLGSSVLFFRAFDVLLFAGH